MVAAAAARETPERKLGRKAHPSTAYRLLHRHGWRKAAPRPGHPKRDPKAAEAFKKGAARRRREGPWRRRGRGRCPRGSRSGTRRG
jgi:hypothetical protein